MTNDGSRIVPLRLQKFLARAGVASRRGSENLMSAGRVTVNGRVVTELGSKVDPLSDEVAVDGTVVHLGDGSVTLMLHKPVGVVTTMSDPQGRPCVADLVPTHEFPGLFPIGRLDRDTTGLLLFSTDGDLGHGLLHPQRHVMKRYLALVEGRPSEHQLEQLRQGVNLDDGFSLPAQVELMRGQAACEAMGAFALPKGVPEAASAEYASVLLKRTCMRSIVRIGIREGRKRQVRRMFDAVGHPVVALHRTDFGPVSLGELASGMWRELSSGELSALRGAADR